MQYVVVLADERSFTRAASLVGVSQSGLSAALRTLEAELGTSLFSRTSRRVEPTAAGLALLPFARSMLAQATAGRDAVVRATQALSGVLRVGAEQCLGVVDVAGLLERFHRRHPQVDISYLQAGSHDLLAGVREGDLDVAFVGTTDGLGTSPAVELGRQPLVLLAPPQHRLATAPGDLAWADLADAALVDLHPTWAVRGLTDAAVEAHGVRKQVRCTVGDVHALLDLVGRGLGVALVPRHVAAKPEAAALVARPLPAGAPPWVVSVVTGGRERVGSPAPHLLELLDVPDDADRPATAPAPRPVAV